MAWPKLKSPVFLIVYSLITIGLVFISISSLTEASASFNNKFYFLQKQLFWIILGSISLYLFSIIDLNILKKYSLHFYLFSILLLILVLIPGIGTKTLGARRWLDLGFFPFQPSEIFKFAAVIFFPHLLANNPQKSIYSFLLYLLPPFILIILEPNLSTAILILFIIISIYFISGGKILPLLGVGAVFSLFIFILIITSPYRKDRLQSLLNPDKNSYHSQQIVISLGSGGLNGKGLANSDQKYSFLPKITTDSIIAIIGEETGFIGISIILYLYFILLSYLFKFSRLIKNEYHSLLVSGITCWLSFQTIINLSAITSIIPLTGVPLPLISYGGSSLVTTMSAIGIILNIEQKQNNEKN